MESSSLVDDASIDIVDETAGSAYFDKVIGHIEDIVLSKQFSTLHNDFMELYWSEFENTEENKLEYTEIFQQYTNTFEHFFLDELRQRMEDFNIERFASEIEEHRAFSDTRNYGEIFELLHSFMCFEIFKEIMLDYRSKKQGGLQHLGCDILVTRPVFQQKHEEILKMDQKGEKGIELFMASGSNLENLPFN